MNADIGAAIDRHHAVTMMLAADGEQVDCELHLGRIEARGLQDLEADTIAALPVEHAAIEAVDDHGAVIG